MQPQFIAMLVAAVGGCAAAQAAPFLPLDPRTLGMGGAAVAAGTGAYAALYNPALLATARDNDDVRLELPALGLRLADTDELRDALADFNQHQYVAQFARAIQAFTAELNGAIRADQLNTLRNRIVDSGEALVTGFQSIAGKSVEGSGNAAIVVGLPAHARGGAFFINAWAVGGAVGEVSQADVDESYKFLDHARTLDLSNQADIINNIVSYRLDDPSALFTSNAQVRAALVTEFGLSLARQKKVFGTPVAVGFTPKFVHVRTYDYRFEARDMRLSEPVNWKTGEKVHNGFNADLGFARDYGKGWKGGLAIKNIIPYSYRTVLGNTVEFEPLARLGVMRQLRWAAVTVDVDLTENVPVGVEDKTRYINFGAEADAWRTVQLRLGYRHNLSSDQPGTMAVGLGFSPWGVHIDAGAAINRHEIAVAAQTGFRF